MALLTAAREIGTLLQTEVDAEVVLDYAIETNTVIYAGALVAVTAGGFLRPCTATSDIFVGIATETVSNNPGAAGAKKCKVAVGAIVRHPVTGGAQAEVGSIVYADIALTNGDNVLTNLPTANLPAGAVWQYISGTTCLVKLFTPGQIAL